MRILAGVMAAAIAATAAQAQTTRVDDTTFLKGARCAGLASSPKLGSADAKALAAWVKAQSRGRAGYLMDRADTVRSDARREADDAVDFQRAKLTAELNGACAAFKG